MIITALALGIALQATPAPVGSADFAQTKSQIHIKASVNGHPGTYIFDTGFAGDVVFDSSLDMGKPSGTITLQDFVGAFQANTYKIKDLQLGSLDIKGGDMQAVAQPNASAMGDEGHVDGLMGFSLIKKYVTTISFEKNKFIFYPSSLDISKWVPNNKTTFLLPMLPIGSRAIMLPVKTADGKMMVMALDTGNAFYATTHKDVLQRVGLWPQDQDAKYKRESFVASGAVTSWEKDMKDLTIFGVPVKNSIWDIIDLPASDAASDGTVGFQFLKNFNITFDFQRRLVWFENFTGKVENQAEGRTGLSISMSRQTGTFQAVLVADGSPADTAGLKVGDKILSIEGTSLFGVSAKQAADMLKGEIGSTVQIAYSRDGFTKRVTLDRVALVNP